MVASRTDYGAVIWYRPKANGSTVSSVQVKKLTTVQWLAMKATMGCYHTMSTKVMELESATQPVWLWLQTKALSSIARIQSLAHEHPVKKWLARVEKTAAQNRKIKHMSNLENTAVQFLSLIKDIQEITTFKRPPWDPNLEKQKDRTDKNIEALTTKEDLRTEIKKLAATKWKEQLEAGNKPGNMVAPYLH